MEDYECMKPIKEYTDKELLKSALSLMDSYIIATDEDTGSEEDACRIDVIVDEFNEIKNEFARRA